MEKITLKLYDFLNLEAELNGVTDPRTQQRTRKGLLHQPLSMGTKYWLSRLVKTVAEEKTIIDALKDELIKKYGTEKEDGSIMVELAIPDLDKKGKPVMVKVTAEDGSEKEQARMVINPQYLAFEKEFNEILQQEKELEYRPFSFADLTTHDKPNGIETDESYDTFFKLVAAE